MSDKDHEVHRAGDAHHGPLSVPDVWAKRIINAFWAGCVILVALDFVGRKVEHPFEQMPGFYAFYGFAGVGLLIVVAKELRKLVARSEDYYDVE